jgi:hypothetical protein
MGAGWSSRWSCAPRGHNAPGRRRPADVGLVDLDAHLARDDHVEQFAAERFEVGALRRVVHQRRPGDEQRTLLRQQQRVERRHRPRGVAVGDQHAERAQAVERAHEDILADAVIDHRDPLAAGDLAHALREVLGRVVDDMVAAVRPGQFALGRRPDGTDHRRPQRLRPLAGNEPDAAGRRMDQHGIPGLHAIGAAQQVGGGQTLQHHRRRGVEADLFRQAEQAVRRKVARLGVGAHRAAGIGDAIADRDLGHALADRLDHPGPLEADPRRQGQRVESAAMIGVDEIEADRGVAHGGFPGGGRRHGDFLPDQHLRTAGPVNADGAVHAGLLVMLFVRKRERITAPRRVPPNTADFAAKSRVDRSDAHTGVSLAYSSASHFMPAPPRNSPAPAHRRPAPRRRR